MVKLKRAKTISSKRKPHGCLVKCLGEYYTATRQNKVVRKNARVLKRSASLSPETFKKTSGKSVKKQQGRES
jgi:hypothetical protein